VSVAISLQSMNQGSGQPVSFALGGKPRTD
jgi:hypothetical protein